MEKTKSFLSRCFFSSTIVYVLFIFFQMLYADSWREIQLNNPPPARYGHSLVNLDGDIYLFGGTGESTMGKSGEAGPFFNDLWRFNIDRSEFECTKVEPDSTPPYPSTAQCMVAQDGTLLVFFGTFNNGKSAAVWRYDPDTNKWKYLIFSDEVPPARSSSTAVNVNGTPFVIGGLGENNLPLGDSWQFNKTNNTWQKVFSLPDGEERYGHGSFIQNGIITVFGGIGPENQYQSKILKISTTDWSIESKEDSRLVQKMAVAPGSPYSFGGREFKSEIQKMGPGFQLSVSEDTVTNQTWMLDSVTESWIRCTDMPIALESAAACAIETEGKTEILVFGGLTAEGVPTNRVFIYTPSETAVETMQSVPDDFSLLQNYPNPFNGETTIAYRLKKAGHLRFQLFNCNGQKICNIVDQYQQAGYHEAHLNASNLTSGVYFLQMDMNGSQINQKIVLME